MIGDVLGVEHCVFESDNDGVFHELLFFGTFTYTSPINNSSSRIGIFQEEDSEGVCRQYA